MREYTVISDDRRQTFEYAVNALLGKGWEPHGGLVVDDSRFYQAMVREVPKFVLDVSRNVTSGESVNCPDEVGCPNYAGSMAGPCGYWAGDHCTYEVDDGNE
jgi:hypothetical protein